MSDSEEHPSPRLVVESFEVGSLGSTAATEPPQPAPAESQPATNSTTGAAHPLLTRHNRFSFQKLEGLSNLNLATAAASSSSASPRSGGSCGTPHTPTSAELRSPRKPTTARSSPHSPQIPTLDPATLIQTLFRANLAKIEMVKLRTFAPLGGEILA